MDYTLTFMKKSGILIPHNFKESELYKKIKEDLTRRVKDYQSSSFTTSTFYLESDLGLLVPRFYPLDKIDQKLTIKIEDNCPDGQDIDIQHNIVPRNSLQERAINYMLKNERGVLQLNPGTGKTVISICAISERKKKSLILVHRDSLVDQWKNEFCKYTNLNENDISRLTSANFTSDLQKSIIISTNQTFISLLRNKRLEFLSSLSKSNIGIFIGDEVHTTVGAPIFAECSIHIPAKVVFGLSATPYRFDGNGDIIEHHLGNIYLDNDDGGTMSAKVLVVLFDYGIIKKSSRYIYWGGLFQRSRYLNLIKNSVMFQGVIRGFINKYKDSREMIIVADRIKLIENLYDWVDSPSKSKFIQSSGNEALEYKITFSTPMKIRDGVNIPQKDCLILTSPISNMEQMSGRIVRQLEGKQQPIIIDMVDLGCKEIGRTIHARLNFYKLKNWEVSFILVNSDGSKQLLTQGDFYEVVSDLWKKTN